MLHQRQHIDQQRQTVVMEGIEEVQGKVEEEQDGDEQVRASN